MQDVTTVEERAEFESQITELKRGLAQDIANMDISPTDMMKLVTLGRVQSEWNDLLK